VAQGGAAFAAGPPVLATFEFANPSVVDVVSGHVSARVQPVEGVVDCVG
jgi:hypothetical protein